MLRYVLVYGVDRRQRILWPYVIYSLWYHRLIQDIVLWLRPKIIIKYPVYALNVDNFASITHVVNTRISCPVFFFSKCFKVSRNTGREPSSATAS